MRAKIVIGIGYTPTLTVSNSTAAAAVRGLWRYIWLRLAFGGIAPLTTVCKLSLTAVPMVTS